jgi:uncharacterized repeat protein (TIGR03803 family)
MTLRISSARGPFHTPLGWLLAVLPFLLLVQSVEAQIFTALYEFNLSSGGQPEAGVTRDAAGNLYGTTFFGGGGTGCDIYFDGCGTVFKVDTTGTETVLHIFGGVTTNPYDGWNPTARLILDAAGNLYGTTAYGGAYGHGVIFRIDTAGNETILHSFAGGRDGARPNAGLVEDTAGNFYGTTQYGGRGCDGQGCGTIFRISPAGQETVLYRFAGGANGASPLGGVAVDSAGTIYGTTWLGGIHSYGTVFMLDTSGNQTVLHSFAGGSDGANPLDSPVLDTSGNLYGTTSAGGPYYGTVFMIDTTGKESTLYNFTGGTDGASPYAHLLVDTSGNLYGTASQGGCCGQGTVFEFSNGTLIALYGFSAAPNGTNLDGQFPMGGLITDSAGNFYGTAAGAGASGWGTVFEIQPSSQSR